MSYSTVSALMTGICDAIRTKDGTTAQINHQDIPDRIAAIKTGITWADVFATDYDKNIEIDFRGKDNAPLIKNVFGQSTPLKFISSLTVYHDSNRFVSFDDSCFMNNTYVQYIKCNCNIERIGSYAFQGTTVTGEVYFGDINSKISSNAFRSFQCDKIVFGAIKSTGLESSAFRQSHINTVDAASISSIGYMAFASSDITALIIRGGSVPTLNANVFDSTPIASGTGYIYVPSSLVAQYQAATNWSLYAAQIRALEDYTIDGTTTGELDPNKI